MKHSPFLLVVSLGVGLVAGGCKGDGAGGSTGTGGVTGTGGSATGGAPGTGGVATGGATGTGGAATGGATGTGGSATGTGGNATGGSGAGGTGGLTGSGGAPAAGHGGGAVGGAAGSGGVAGATGGAAGGSGGTISACAYKLCENFESGAVGALPTGWTAYNGYGGDAMKGVGLANDQAHSGTMSLKSSSVTPGEERIQKSLAALGATATKHWGRIFYKVQSPAPKTSGGVYFHTTMVALEGTTENRVVDSVQNPDGAHQWIFNVPDDSCCTGSAYSWTFDASWHCAEWYVDVSTNSYRFFSDSTEVTSLAFTNNTNAKMSSYTALVVGSIFFQTPPSPFVVWMDDLAINDAQIGCK